MRHLVIAVLLTVAAGHAAASAQSLYQQRAAYRQALDDLAAGRSSAFREARLTLEDYALAPYLDYYDVQTRLSSVSDDEMRAFQARHGDLPVSGVLHHRWLKNLGARREWQRLLDNYQPSSDAELRCYHQRALLARGRRDEAFTDVSALWVVGRSQPKACDPLFEAWIEAGGLTEGQAWERLQLALDANERRLGRYLLRFFEGQLKPWAEALYDFHIEPQRIAERGAMTRDNPYARVVIGHALKRLALRDAEAAARAWQRFEDSHDFAPDEARIIREAVQLAQARAGTFPPRGKRNGPTPSEDFASAMATAALAAENWQELLHWLEQLPDQTRSDLRWQYWTARALTRTHLASERARLTYESLAEERNYYGFLAAQQLGRAPRLNPAPLQDDLVTAARLRELPGMRRALELYAVGDQVNARREWFALVPGLSREEQYQAARLAQQVGWLAQGIFTANHASLYDSVEVRFPLAYPDVFQRISHVTTVPQPFLMAVARQESAFDPRARSSANARGLMQLLHPTAQQVARRIGQTAPSSGALYDPALNVELGGHHLATLLDRYQKRRPVAAAAYNAGQGRVDRWIAGVEAMPMDVWIESIPFRETRDYVKNVLAFTQVYAQLLDIPLPMLEAHERVVEGT